MNKTRYILFVTFICLPSYFFCSPNSNYVASRFYKKEVVNGIEFVYEERIENGIFQLICMVSGKKVSFKEYEKERIEAEVTQISNDRKAEYKKRFDEFEEKRVASILILKKLAKYHLDTIKEMLAHIQSQKLQNYLIFNNKTFMSAVEFNEQSQDALASGKQMLDESTSDGDIEKMKMIEQKLDLVTQRLHTLIYDSINNAIKNCDDPRMLKDLLIMVEGL